MLPAVRPAAPPQGGLPGHVRVEPPVVATRKEKLDPQVASANLLGKVAGPGSQKIPGVVYSGEVDLQEAAGEESETFVRPRFRRDERSG